ncbi:MAG: CARDB domain-containing protein [Gaiellaceae bacterium]|jgi:hypothetical protein
MNGLRDFWKPRRRGGKIVLVVSVASALAVIAAVAAGCGSAKKSDTGIAYVKVLGSGTDYSKALRNETLREGTTRIIVLRSNLAFTVGVKNEGDHPEQNVKVTLAIGQLAPNRTITRTLTIPRIQNGATKEVDFKGPFNIGTLISPIPIKVDVHPVAGETNRSNNSATYKVRFSF